MKRWTVVLLLLLPALALAAPVTLEWDPNPPVEQVTHYCVQVNAATVAPCVTSTQATVAAVAGDVLTVTAHNAAGLSSEPSLPVTVPAVTMPAGVRFRVVVTVEVQ